MICARCGQENPDGFRFCGACGAALEAAPAREVRKTVTVLFCDVAGSTALGERTDPEALRHVMRRYFDEIRAAIERHGGTVEKFIGDAAMAVFGVPQVREDDALRAVRAADEIRARLPGVAAKLGVELTFRTGINTGEVVVGEGQTLATGDAVNVAARLEQAAAAGEILLGAETQRLVRDAVEVEPLEPLALRGKERPVEAFRLVRVDPAAPGLARHLDTPLVGREPELALLRQAFERAATERSCVLVTLLGAAGVGKSRLVAEFLHGLGGEAQTIGGRCLHYGDGITFWPLVEALKRLGGAADETVAHVVDGAASSPADLFWEVRKLLERVAQERPLVAVFDDLHWAQPMFLDLLDHVADLSRDAPILLLCVGRPELLDERPGWGGGKLNATTTLLEALSPAECERLLDALGDSIEPDARRRIVAASEGNPLFVEEMAALAREQGDVSVPSSIQALLAARLDRLAPDERTVIERGAVEGKVFHRGAVRELAPEPVRPAVEAHLASLVRKELIRPERGPIPDDEAFRFRHLLIRDAAYESLPKETRAVLHERFAAWLEAHGPELVERDEIVGYHLEQAIRYRRELGEDVDATLARSAGERLAAAALRARHRWDTAAARSLYARALELLPPGPERARLLTPYAAVLTTLGEFDAAGAVLDEAAASGDELAIVRARIGRLEIALPTEPDSLDEQEVRGLIADLERLGDEDSLVQAWRLVALYHWLRSHAGPAVEAIEHAHDHASPNATVPVTHLDFWMASVTLFGPFEQAETERVLERLERLPPTAARDAAVCQTRAVLAMLAGRDAEAWRNAVAAIDHYRDSGEAIASFGGEQVVGQVALRAGRLAEGEQRLRASIAGLEGLGDRAYVTTNMTVLADLLLAQGRLDEAGSTAAHAEELSAAADATTLSESRRIQAEVALARGDAAAAVEIARRAVAVADATDFALVRGGAHLALARAAAATGDAETAAASAGQALGLFRLKGDVRCTAYAETLLAELSPSAA